MARWYAPDATHAFEGSPLDHYDLMRVLEEFRGRTRWGSLPDDHDALVENVGVEPNYEPACLTASQQEIFREHLGVIAFGKAELDLTVGVFTRTSSWTYAKAAVRVVGNIVLSSLTKVSSADCDEESAVQEHVPAWYSTDDVLHALADDPCRLMSHLELGVRAYGVKSLHVDASALSFEIGAAFQESVNALNYHRDSRYASACLRAMALIAAGRSGELAGHPERAGAGGNNPVLTTRDGRQVQRSYLAQNSPNAHRIFWLRGHRPTFLNVSGHEGSPVMP